jgi:replication-associated recombination protein RarA
MTFRQHHLLTVCAPRELKDLIGQTNLIGKGKPLCKLITGKSNF